MYRNRTSLSAHSPTGPLSRTAVAGKSPVLDEPAAPLTLPAIVEMVPETSTLRMLLKPLSLMNRLPAESPHSP